MTDAGGHCEEASDTEEDVEVDRERQRRSEDGKLFEYNEIRDRAKGG